MDNDRMAGLGKKVSGSIKEAIGKITGDRKMQTEGTTERAAGTVQNAVGGAKDTARDLIKE